MAGVGENTGGTSPWAGWDEEVRSVVLVTVGTVKVVAPRNCSRLLSKYWIEGGVRHGFQNLESADPRGLDTSSVKDMECMFNECSSLVSLDVSTWDTSNVMDTWSTFRDRSSLSSFKVSPSYQIKSADSFPDATAGNGKWWSSSDSKWYAKDEIVASRSCVC